MKVFLSIFLILSLLIHSKGQTITATGGMWSNSIVANTITVAGNDYNQNITSLPNHTLLEVNPSAVNWVVRLNKVDGNWHNSLELFVMRTGGGNRNGNAPSTVTGGNIYSIVQNSSLEFFRGTHRTFNIPIQYEIRGLSVLLPAGNYSTTVYYTISDN